MNDELMTAIVGELRAHGIDNPQAVIAVAHVAARILGRDRCVCRQSMHSQHPTTPVDGCPWCKPGPYRRRARGGRTRCRPAACSEGVAQNLARVLN